MDTEEDLETIYGSLSYDFNWNSDANNRDDSFNIASELSLIGFPVNHLANNSNYKLTKFEGDMHVDDKYLTHRLPTSKGVGGAPII